MSTRAEADLSCDHSKADESLVFEHQGAKDLLSKGTEGCK